MTLQCFSNHSSVANNKRKHEANLLTKTNGKFLYRNCCSQYLGKTPSLGFNYRENREVNLNLKGKFPVVGDAVEFAITQNTSIVKRLTSQYLHSSIV